MTRVNATSGRHDGENYVFVSNALEGIIGVFSIDSGDFMASIDTCGSPCSLDYHPTRDEVWVHCGPLTMTKGVLDMSTFSLQDIFITQYHK